ncbi:MAG: putative chorismate mutase [Gemmatimonadetes bacterium]|nr:putative chorismate mutase [Gemmatimonadota bacterium]
MIAVSDHLDRAVEQARTELADCRTAIEELDLRIIALLAERVALGQKTAGLKRTAGLPILDPQREAQVIRRAVAAARAKELPTESVRQIFWHIVGLSRRVQEEKE